MHLRRTALHRVAALDPTRLTTLCALLALTLVWPAARAGAQELVSPPESPAGPAPPERDTGEPLLETPPLDLPPSAAPEVQAVRIRGNRSLGSSAIRRVLATQASGCKSPLFFAFCRMGDFDWAERKYFLTEPQAVPLDAERIATLYEAWGFPDAEVSWRVVTERDGDVVVAFDVEEGEPILLESLAVRGLERVDPPLELPRWMPLREGNPYALPLLERTEELLLALLAERGHPFASVEVSGSVDEASRAARIVLDLAPGPQARFGAVEINADEPIAESVIRTRLTMRPGDPFRPSALERTESEIYQLPIVEAAIVQPLGLQPGDSVIPLRVTVGARRVHGLVVEGSVSTTDCVEAQVQWQHRHFLDAPRLFTLSAGASNLLARQASDFPCTAAGSGVYADPDYFVEAGLHDPLPISPGTSYQVQGFYRRGSAPDVYVQRGGGARLAVAQRLSRSLTASLAYLPERNRLEAAEIYYCGNYGVCDREGIRLLDGPSWLAPVELTAVWQPTGRPALVPPVAAREPGPPPPYRLWRYGASAGVELARSATGSDHHYTRGIAEGTLTRLLSEHLELAARFRAGVMLDRSPVPPPVRLFSGGVNTVRGAAQNLLGPTVLVTGAENLPRIGCEPVASGCPPGVMPAPDLLNVRPTGGDRLLETSVEGRRWMSNALQLAAFVDVGVVWGDVLARPDARDVLVAPGIGMRLITGLGPIRLDVGVDTRSERVLPLLTQDPGSGSLLHVGEVVFDPFEFDDPGFARELLRRLQIHVTLGQAF